MVNGKGEGNQCGAISAFAKLCASALTKWLVVSVADALLAEAARRGVTLLTLHKDGTSPLSKEVLVQWILVGLALEEIE